MSDRLDLVIAQIRRIEDRARSSAEREARITDVVRRLQTAGAPARTAADDERPAPDA